PGIAHGRRYSTPRPRVTRRCLFIHTKATVMPTSAPVGVSDATNTKSHTNSARPFKAAAAISGRSQAAITTDQWPCKSLSMTKGLATANAIADSVGRSSLLLNHHAPVAEPTAEATIRALTTQVAGITTAIMLKKPSCGALRAKRSPPPKFDAVICG